MQLKVFTISTLFVLHTSSVYAFSASEDAASTNLNARQPDFEASLSDIRDVELTGRDVELLVERAKGGTGTIRCANQGQIKRVKPLYQGKCQPSQSKGWRSAHNCPGKSYLCVQSDKATCYVSQITPAAVVQAGWATLVRQAEAC